MAMFTVDDSLVPDLSSTMKNVRLQDDDSGKRSLDFGTQREAIPLHNKQTITAMIGNYITFARNTGLNAQDLNDSIRKCIIMSIKSIDKHEVYNACFDAKSFIDWNYIDNKMTSNPFGDFAHCIELVLMLDFSTIDTILQDTTNQHCMALNNFIKNLQQTTLYTTTTDAIRLFILTNMTHITGSNVTEQYLTRIMQRSIGQPVLQFVASLADNRFSITHYSDAMTIIIKHCHILPILQHEMSFYVTQQETLSNAMKMRFVETHLGRPRLRDKRSKPVQPITLHTTMGQTFITHDTIDTFDAWCVRVRFPNIVSNNLKRKLYLIMSQIHIDHRKILHLVIKPDLVKLVEPHKITHPDVKVRTTIYLCLFCI